MTDSSLKAAPAARPAPRRAPRARAPHRRIGGTMGRRRYLRIAVTSFVVLLAGWWALTASGLVNPLFLPGPLEVLQRLWAQATNGELWTDTWASVYRIGVGYLAATAMAVPLGLLMGTYRVWEAAVEPTVDFIRYMPVVAFVPLTILWVGIDDPQKFLIIWMGTFFQQVLMVASEVRRVPPDLVNLGRTLGMGDRKILARIVFPSAAPGIWDTLRVTLGWAWTWLVVAELVAADSGLGYRITVAQRFFATDTIIAYVIVLGLLGLITDQTMRAVRRKVFRTEGIRA